MLFYHGWERCANGNKKNFHSILEFCIFFDTSFCDVQRCFYYSLLLYRSFKQRQLVFCISHPSFLPTVFLHISGSFSLDLQQTIVCVLQRWTVKIPGIVDVRRTDTVYDRRLICVNAQIVTESARIPV